MLCNHVAFDGVASLILLGDLRDEYESVLDGRPTRPPDWSPRTLEAHDLDVDWRTAATVALRSVSSWWRAPVSTHVDPGPLSDQPAEDHAVMELGPVLETLTPARRKFHWSVDAVLVGVLEKAWADVFGPARAESSWLVARDLRPALGWARGIGNLSTAAGVSIADPTSDLMTVIDRAEAALATQSPSQAAAALPLGRWRQAADVTFASMLRRSARLRANRSVSNVGQLGRVPRPVGSGIAAPGLVRGAPGPPAVQLVHRRRPRALDPGLGANVADLDDRGPCPCLGTGRTGAGLKGASSRNREAHSSAVPVGSAVTRIRR